MSGPIVIVPIMTSVVSPTLIVSGGLLTAAGAIVAAAVVAELMSAREERMAKIKDSLDKYNAARKKMEAQERLIANEFAKEIQLLDEHAEFKLAAESIREIHNKYHALSESFLIKPLPVEAEDIDELAEDMTKANDETLQAYFKEVQQHLDRFIDFKEQMTNFNRANYDFTFEEIEGINSLAIDYDFTGLSKKIADTVFEVISGAEFLINNDFINEKEKKALLSTVNSVKNVTDARGKEYEKRLDTYYSQYLLLKSGIEERMTDFECMYKEYIAENIDYANMTGQTFLMPPRDKYSSLDELSVGLKELKRKSKDAMCNLYLQEQLDEVMTMFGYNVGERLVLNKNQKGDHILCEKKGDDSAVHLYVSEKNEIMIEVVGHGEYEDNKINNDTVNAKIIENKDLVSAEKTALFEKQKSFCDVQIEMVKELEKRGIIIGEVRHSDADEKYCKKILTKKFSAGDKKGDTVTEKVMRRIKKEKLKEINMKNE